MKFFLKTKKNEGNAPLFFEVCKRTPKVKMQFNTFVSVDIQRWQKASASNTAFITYSRTPEGAKVTALLASIEKAVNDLFVMNRIKGKEDRPLIVEAVASISFAEEREKVQRERERKEAEERKEHERIMNQYRDILGFFDWFYSGVQRDDIRVMGKKYSELTKRTWNTFGGILRGFMATRHEKTFDEVTPMFKESFSAYLRSRGYMVGTMSQQTSKFRALCRYAAKYGYNNNATTLTGWETRQPKKNEKKSAVYLTENELAELYKLPLRGNKEAVRDMFFVGAHIGQRWSDFSRISKDMVKVIDGTLFLMFTQQKTGKEMVIPVTDERVLAILKKYRYTFPKLDARRFGEALHSVMRKLSERVPSLKEEVKTIPTLYDQRTTKEKWECVSSHTARRSAVTNMCKRGELTKREMMAITGHSTEKIFEDYIKFGTLEQAKRIAEKLSRDKVKQVKVNIS